MENTSKCPQAGLAFLRAHKDNPEVQEALARVQTTLRAFAAGIALIDRIIPKREAEEELRKIWAEFRGADEVYRRDWQQTFGEPFPVTIEDWERWAIRADVSSRYLPAEKIASGNWTAADIMPYVEGYLQRIKDGTTVSDNPDEIVSPDSFETEKSIRDCG